MSSTVPHIVLDAPYRSDVVASPTPEIGWRTETSASDWRQAGAEIEVTRGGDVATHRIDGRASTRITWPFPPLAPREEVLTRVRVTGEDGARCDLPAGAQVGLHGQDRTREGHRRARRVM